VCIAFFYLSSLSYYIQDAAAIPVSACYICLAWFITPRAGRIVSVIPVFEKQEINLVLGPMTQGLNLDDDQRTAQRRAETLCAGALVTLNRWRLKYISFMG
jgi:hypothetical protein